MKQKSLQNIVSAAIIVLGMLAVFGLSNFIEGKRPPLPEGSEDQDLALQGAKLKNYSLGMNGLFADWYWMQSLQYIGDKLAKNPEMNINLNDLRPLNPRLLYPLLDNATSLDPKYIAVYSYGAIVLPAIDNEQAIKITKKGIENNPNEWRLYQHLGYIYWKQKDYEKASETYEQGSKINGAPPFMQMMVAQMKSKGGSRETAKQIYQQMYEDAQDTQTKESAALHLLGLEAKDELEKINPVVKSFKENNGRCAADWRELFPLLRTQKTDSGRPLRFESVNYSPVDPKNVPYYLFNKPERCEAVIDTKKSKIPVE